MFDSRREVPDLLRSAGGPLLAAGALALLIRKSSHHEWSNLARLLVVLVPAAALYLLALGPSARRQDATDTRASRAVLLVTAIALVPLVLLLFLRLVDASTDRLSEAGVFVLTALLAGYGAHAARVSYAALLAGLALLVAWLLVWAEILGHPSADTYRWLLIAAAVLLLAGAAWLARSTTIGAGELATAGGLAAIAAGTLGVIAGLAAGALRAITSVGETSGSSLRGSGSAFGSAPGLVPQLHGTPTRGQVPLPIHLHIAGLQRFGWDLYLLVVALALVWLASRARVRGLGYVGALGLLAFVVSVGLQVTRLELGHSPSSELLGWPLALLILGLAGLLAPALARRAR